MMRGGVTFDNKQTIRNGSFDILKKSVKKKREYLLSASVDDGRTKSIIRRSS